MIGFTETVLRDANQSLAATRLSINDFVDILEKMDKAGYYSVECWGGATFDSCIRYLSEDPWERLRIIKKHMPNTKLQMLLRGQNLLGYSHYPTFIVDRFIESAIKNGIDIIRIFDALNDLDNIKDAVNATLKYGGHPSCAICYTVSPVHKVKNFVDLALKMESMGAQSICVKDMSGCLLPDVAYELISSLKESLNIPVILHSHCTPGMAQMTYLKAMEAGVDVLDTAVSCFSGGTSQPATETIALAAKALGRKSALKFDIVSDINNYFVPVVDKMIGTGIINHHSMQTDPRSLVNQIPGGMYSNLLSQMENQDMLDKFNDVLEEVPRVRKDLGYPPLVTPISQMVGTQALANIVSEKRYSILVSEVKAYLMGKYGRSPGDINREVFGNFIAQDETANSDDLIEEYIKRIKSGYEAEDALIYILFPQLAENFFAQKQKETGKLQFECIPYDGIEPNVNDKLLKNIDDDTRALLIAIIAHYLNVESDVINIKKIWEQDCGVLN